MPRRPDLEKKAAAARASLEYLGGTAHDAYLDTDPKRALGLTYGALASALGLSTEGGVRQRLGSSAALFSTMLEQWGADIRAFRLSSRSRFEQHAHKPLDEALPFVLRADFEGLGDTDAARGRERMFYLAVAWADHTGKLGKAIREQLQANRDGRDEDLARIYGTWLRNQGRSTVNHTQVLQVVTALLEGIYLERRFGGSRQETWTAENAAAAVLAVMRGMTDQPIQSRIDAALLTQSPYSAVVEYLKRTEQDAEILWARLDGEQDPLVIASTPKTKTSKEPSLEETPETVIAGRVRGHVRYREILLVRSPERLDDVLEAISGRGRQHRVETAVLIPREQSFPVFAPLVAGDAAFLVSANLRNGGVTDRGDCLAFNDHASVSAVRRLFEDLWTQTRCFFIWDETGVRDEDLHQARSSFM